MARRAGWLGIGIALLLSTAATAFADADDDYQGWNELTRSDLGVVKLDADGDVAWSSTLGNSFENDFYRATAVAVDGAGNVFAAAALRGRAPVLVKLNPHGRVLWTVDYANAPINGATIEALAVGDSGNAFTVGTLWIDGGPGRMLSVVKLRADGVVAWAATADAPAAPTERATGTGIALDVDGGPIVVGDVEDAATRPNLFVAKFSAAGELLGSFQYGAERFTSRGRRVAANPDGGAFVAGVTYDDPESLIVLSFDAAGELIWTHAHAIHDGASACMTDLPPGAYRGPVGLFPTGAGGVAIAAIQSNGDSCWMVEAMDATGNERWVREATGTFGHHEIAADFASDADGVLYLAGWQTGDYSDALVARKIGTDGEITWVQIRTEWDTAHANGVAPDAAGAAVVAGFSCYYYDDSQHDFSRGEHDECELLATKVGSDGRDAWTVTWNPTGESSETGAADVAVDADGNALIAATVCRYVHHPGQGGGGGDEDDDDDGGTCAVGDGNALTLVTLMLAIGGMAWLESRRRLGRR